MMTERLARKTLLTAVALAMTLSLSACASMPMKSDGGGGADGFVSGEGPPKKESRASAQEELKALEAMIKNQGYREEFGVESGGNEPDSARAPSESGPDCEKRCEAAEAICTSSERICVISGRFPDDPHFTERCTWAGGECAKAKEVCSSCE